MRINVTKRRPPGETIIPMINVVFLLLVFFLLTAQIAPPEPFALSPPDGTSETPAQNRGVLYVSAQGDLAYDDARGEDAWALIAARSAAESLEIRSDGRTDAAFVAALLKRLRETSDVSTQLVVSGG